ncbi:MAG: hypothetical protein WA862_09165 [Solirubrobacterales bacterium]
MRPRAHAIGILALALGLLAMPAGAAGAKPNFEVQERSLRLNLAIAGSNGFRGFVSTEGHKQVALTLIKGGILMDLRTRGRVSRHGIVARFGDLAKISVRFQDEPDAAGPKRGRRGDSASGCSGRDPIVERGVFHGTIRFRGENEFTRIDAQRAPGTVEHRFRRVCKQSLLAAFEAALEEIFGSLRVDLLEARARVDGTNVAFEAASFDVGSLLGPGVPPSYGFVGRTVERGDGMRVIRVANVEGGGGTLLAGKPGANPQTATVVPPKPFLETAKHLKERGIPASWIGPLAVRLPGAGPVPLTGPGFKSAFCSLTLAELVDGTRCLPRRGDEPGPNSLAAQAMAAAQGSGSQSQAFWDARLSWSR